MIISCDHPCLEKSGGFDRYFDEIKFVFPGGVETKADLLKMTRQFPEVKTTDFGGELDLDKLFSETMISDIDGLIKNRSVKYLTFFGKDNENSLVIIGDTDFIDDPIASTRSEIGNVFSNDNVLFFLGLLSQAMEEDINPYFVEKSYRGYNSFNYFEKYRSMKEKDVLPVINDLKNRISMLQNVVSSIEGGDVYEANSFAKKRAIQDAQAKLLVEKRKLDFIFYELEQKVLEHVRVLEVLHYFFYPIVFVFLFAFKTYCKKYLFIKRWSSRLLKRQ